MEPRVLLLRVIVVGFSIDTFLNRSPSTTFTIAYGQSMNGYSMRMAPQLPIVNLRCVNISSACDLVTQDGTSTKPMSGGTTMLARVASHRAVPLLKKESVFFSA